jgi:murein DD-endopeptidase MepM/ murein hydrolase activator NlpD
MVLAMALGGPAAVDAAVPFYFPAPAGTEWQVAAGYNTATHSYEDGGDPYALDIVRTDGPTAGTPVLAPVAGTITFVGRTGSQCVGMRDAPGNRILLCHLNPDPGLGSGQQVARGARLGTVAPAGEAANNGLAHIHLAVHQGTGSWSAGTTLPFVGQYAIEGVELPAVSTSNAYAGVRFVSTNRQNRPPTVDAGPDLTVRPGAEVTIVATGSDPDGGALTYVWAQVSGPAVSLAPSGPRLTFTAPDVEDARLRFTVTVIDPGTLYASDSVEVLVTASAAPPGDTPLETSQLPGWGTITAGSIPPSGFGLVQFGGGTSEQLVEAAGCAVQTLRFWAIDLGRYVPFIPAAAAFVNAEWRALFPDVLPAGTILTARCA